MQAHLYNINVERAILSSILFDPRIYEEVASVIEHRDFYLDAHQNIFKEMNTLYLNDKPIDQEFIKDNLIRNKKFQEDDYLNVISTNPLINVEAYVKDIKDKSIKRDILSLSSEIQKVVSEENIPATEMSDIVQSKLYAITQSSKTSDFKESLEVSKETLAHILKMKERGNSILIGLDTGFRDLNLKTSGFANGDLIIIAARPSMGKTTLVLNMAQKVLENNQGVAFFSLEMPAEQLMMRMLSSKTSIPLQDLRIGNLNDEQWSDLSKAIDTTSKQKLFIDDEGMINIHQLKSKLRKLKSNHPEVSIAIIDYLQLMNGTSGKDRHLEVSEISRGLKLLARELDMPIIALSQLNRGLESRGDKRPMLSDLRESGAIEQDADVILFVYRDDVYKMRDEKEKEMKAKAEGKTYESNFEIKEEEDAEIIIGKQRNGPIGIANLVFQKRFTRFADKSDIGGLEFSGVSTDIDIGGSGVQVVDMTTI